MMRGKGFLVLVVLTALVGAGAYMSINERPQVPQTGQMLFPNALAKVNDITQVEVINGGETFSLQRDDAGSWTAPARDGFPADNNKVRKLVVGIADLQRLEPKTAKPERFKELGLRDPMIKDSQASQFVLRDAEGSAVAELVVGHSRPAKGDPTRSEIFVRVPSEKQSWLVIGSLPEKVDTVIDWLQTTIIELDDERIALSRNTHHDGELVTVQRDSPSTQNFTYLELMPGAKATDVWRINDIGRLFVNTNFYEVQSADSLPKAEDGVKVSNFTTETFDGLRVHMKMFDIGPQPLVVLRAEYDESIVQAAHSKAKAEDVRAEVEMLNKRWSPWAYQIPKYKGDAVRRRQENMEQAPDKPAAS